MKKRTFEKLGETLYTEVLENGLTVHVVPKPDFGKSYAFFATRYGGMDTKFELDGQWYDTPAGIAHYLEHKMFDTEDGNALQDLAANGASPNAITSNAITGYYFESTEKFEENLRILLSFVSIPYFTKESVEKEQGIISQEIRMIEDEPEWRVYMALVESLFQHHPVRTSVAGTVGSISHITHETLYACHKAFYDPANMVLTVAGNVEPERICAIAREILPAKGEADIPRDYGQPEPEQAYMKGQTLKMEVSTPLFQLGFKVKAQPDGPERYRQSLLGDLACEAVFGESTPLYAKLYADGLINKSFAYGYEDEPGAAFLMAGGESRDPAAVRKAVEDEVARLNREGVDSALWERLKKAAYGSKVRQLNSFEYICVSMAQAHFSKEDFFSFPEVFASLTKEDVEEFIRANMGPDKSALAVVEPKGETA